MTTAEFIQYAANKIAQTFPDVTISYEFRPNELTHFIKVVPENTYSSEGFMDLEGVLYQEWVSEVGQMDEDICFVSVDSLVQLEQDEVIYQPSVNPVFEISLQWANEYFDLLQHEYDHLLQVTPETPVVINQRHFSIKGLPEYEEFDEPDASVYSLAA